MDAISIVHVCFNGILIHFWCMLFIQLVRHAGSWMTLFTKCPPCFLQDLNLSVICRDSIVSSCATNKKPWEVQRHPSGLRRQIGTGFHEVFFVIIPPWNTNIYPPNWWLEDAVSSENGPFFRGHVNFRRCNWRVDILKKNPVYIFVPNRRSSSCGAYHHAHRWKF